MSCLEKPARAAETPAPGRCWPKLEGMPAAESDFALPLPVIVPPAIYRPRRLLPAVLFLLTALSMLVVGARMQYNFDRVRPPFRTFNDVLPFLWAWRHPGMLLLGAPFCATLLAILLAHELGHYIACLHYGMAASLPYFLPAPTLLGTLGAFIRIHSPFPSRRALIDVGIAGPLAGFAIAAPCFWLGLRESFLRPFPAAAAGLNFGWPAAARLLLPLAQPGVAAGQLYLSPVARAAWFGFLATMLNLIPAGQLDGGHILYAVAPRLHRWVSWLLAPALALAGWRYWQGWYIWAGFVLLMQGRHPGVPYGPPLGRRRRALVVAGAIILAITFTIVPVRVG